MCIRDRHNMSHDRICTSSVSVVRINGNTIRVGVYTLSSYVRIRCGARACAACVCSSSHVKVVFWHVSGRVNVQVSVWGCKLVT